MTPLLKAVLLGAVQGVTEFLPISSTGHLILVERILGVSQETYGLTFDVALHMGTLVAILWFFRKEWKQLYTSVLRIIKVRKVISSISFLLYPAKRDQLRKIYGYNKRTNEDYKEKLVGLLFVGTIPAVILGLLLEDAIDTLFRSPTLVAAALIVFSGVLYYVEKLGHKHKDIVKLSWFDGLAIGTAQTIALLPGVSRSGITIAAGMWRNLKRDDAARFAFLLSAPIILGAGGKKIIEMGSMFLMGALTAFDLLFFATGMISAAVFGYLTIKYFLQYLSHHSLLVFIWYRILLGLVVLGIFFLK